MSYALNTNPNKQRCIVTTESSKPRKKRANRHIPDVCNTFGIPCCNSFDFFKFLKFSTNWKIYLSE
ncbi:MAG: DUF4411 family protein [Anaerolineales bacterium]|nr:DUF4411 family protein [Anaerolineales bacterium]